MMIGIDDDRYDGGDEETAREEEEEEAEDSRVAAKKQEPHTEMWGKKKHAGATQDQDDGNHWPMVGPVHLAFELK